MKRAAIIGGMILVGLLAAAIIGPSFINWNQYRGQITAAVRDRTGFDVTIDGDLGFQIIPSPALTVQNLSVANAEAGAAGTLLALDGLEVHVALLPLIGGEIQVESIVLESPTVTIERLPDGRMNWELIGAGSAPDSGPTGPGPDVSLDQVEIRNGRLLYHDLATGERRDLAISEAQLSAGSLRGPFTLTGEVSSNAVPLTLDLQVGRMEPGRRVPFRFIVGVEGGSRLTLSGSGDARDGRLENLTGKIDLSGSDLRSLVLQASTLAGAAIDPGDGLSQTFRVSTPFSVTGEALAFEDITLALGDATGNGALTYRGGDAPSIDVAWTQQSLVLDPLLNGAANDDDEPGSFPDFPTDLTADIHLVIEALSYRGSVLRQAAIDGRLAEGRLTISNAHVGLPGGSDVRFSGVLTSVRGKPIVDGKIDALSNNLSALLTWADMRPAGIPTDKLTNALLSTDVRLREDRLELAGLTAQIDLTGIEGGMTIGLGGEGPDDRRAIAVDARIDRLNLDSYGFGRSSGTLPSNDATVTAGSLRAELLKGLAPLGDLDAAVTLALDSLTWRGGKFRAVVLDASLIGAGLTLKKATVGSLQGARLSLSGTVTDVATDPKLDITLAASAENPVALLRWAGVQPDDMPQGLANLSLSGTVAGSLDRLDLDLKGGLSGTRVTVVGALLAPLEQWSLDAMAVTVNHASHRRLMKLLMPDVTVAGPNAPVDLTLQLTGEGSAIRGSANGSLFGGEIEIGGEWRRIGEGQYYAADLQYRHAQAKTLLANLGLALNKKSPPLGVADLLVSMTGNDDEFVITDFAATLGPLAAQGTLQIENLQNRPFVRADLKLGNVPVDAFRTPARTGARAKAQKRGERWSKAPLKLGGLKGFDAEIEVTARQITFGDYQLLAPELGLSLKDGILTTRNFTAGLFGGTMAADLIVDARDVPGVDITLSLEDAELEAALQSTAALAPATGTLSFFGRYKATGPNQLALISSLEGSGKLKAVNGVINGIDIPRLSERMERVERLPQFLSVIGAALGGGTTAYRTVQADIVARKGIARMNNLVADIDGADVDGKGAVNLPAWRMNGTAEIRLKDHAKAPPIHVRVKGPIDAPQVNFQTDRIKSYMGNMLAVSVLESVLGDGSRNDGLDDLTGAAGDLAKRPKREAAPLEEQIGDFLIDSILGKKKPPPPSDRD